MNEKLIPLTVKGYTLEIDGQISHAYFYASKEILKDAEYDMLNDDPDGGDVVKIVPVTMTMTRR